MLSDLIWDNTFLLLSNNSIPVLGILFLALAIIIILVLYKGYKNVSASLFFQKNIAKNLVAMFDQLELPRSLLPVLDSDELELLANNCVVTSAGFKMQDSVSNYICNIYQEKLILCIKKDVGLGKKLWLFANNQRQFAFVETKDKSYRVFSQKDGEIGVLNGGNTFIQASKVLSKINFNQTEGNQTIELQGKEIAGLSKIANRDSKVPVRHFIYFDTTNVLDKDAFWVVLYASLMDVV